MTDEDNERFAATLKHADDFATIDDYIKWRTTKGAHQQKIISELLVAAEIGLRYMRAMGVDKVPMSGYEMAAAYVAKARGE
jgi:hypothetical protein